jgi:hypothetical protein
VKKTNIYFHKGCFEKRGYCFEIPGATQRHVPDSDNIFSKFWKLAQIFTCPMSQIFKVSLCILDTIQKTQKTK